MEIGIKSEAAATLLKTDQDFCDLQSSIIEPDKNIGSSIGNSFRSRAQKDNDCDDFERILEDYDINMGGVFSPVRKLPTELQ